MGYNDDSYEDELDRMRARRQNRRGGRSGKPSGNAQRRREQDSFQVYDDLDQMSTSSGSGRAHPHSGNYGAGYGEDYDDDYGDHYSDDYGDGPDGGYGDEYDDSFDEEDDGRHSGGYPYDEEEDDRRRRRQPSPPRRGNRSSSGSGAGAGYSSRNGSQNASRNASKNASRSGSRLDPGDGSRSNRSPRRHKKHRLLKIFLLVAVLAVGYLAFQWMRDDSYWTVAVFGVDSRDGNVGKGAHSDVEMLCSINKKTGEIRLVSVFRDSYLRIGEDGDYDKINRAYFDGGHKQAVDALKANLDLQIDDYATFNWKAIVDAINVLGGVDMEITDREFAYINSFITETVNSTGIGSVQLKNSGMNHLDGVQAVAYARLRLMDTDFNRTERQRKVLGQAMEKAKNADAATLKNLVMAVYPQTSTSIGIDDLLPMAKNARKYYIGQTSGFPFSHQEMKIGSKDCVVPTTLESNVIQLHSFLYDTAEYTPSPTVREISSHIAEKTGLGAPGKDMESGKNIGSEGNSGGGQGSGGNADKPAPEPTRPPETETTPPETESQTEETESTSEEPTDETSTVAPIEPDETRPEEGGPGVQGHTTEAPAPEEEGPGVSGGTSGTPGGIPQPEPNESNASLEGPGQSAGSQPAAEEQGPGV